MPDESLSLPEPGENAPEIAKKAYELTVQSLREKQALSVERSKSYGLEAAELMSEWVLKVAKGEEIVEQITPSGQKYTVPGQQFLFSNASNLKAVGSFIQSMAGDVSTKGDQLTIAILNRGSQPPVKIAQADIIESEIVE